MLQLTLANFAHAAVVLAQAQQTQSQGGLSFVIWGVLLLGIAVALFFLETFIPSGGLLGIASAVAAVVGVVFLFLDNATLGLIGAIAAVVALPFAMGFAIKLWPNTPIGRALTLRGQDKSAAKQSTAGEEDEDEDGPLPPHPAARGVDNLTAGATGRALTDMRPVGTCVFDTRREECLAVGGIIPAGSPVRVVAVDGMHVKVRAIDN